MDLRVLSIMGLLSVKHHLALRSAEAMIEHEALEESCLRAVDYPVFLTMICGTIYINNTRNRRLSKNVLKIIQRTDRKISYNLAI